MSFVRRALIYFEGYPGSNKGNVISVLTDIFIKPQDQMVVHRTIEEKSFFLKW